MMKRILSWGMVSVLFLSACTATSVPSAAPTSLPTQEPQLPAPTETAVPATETAVPENTPSPAPEEEPTKQPGPYPVPGELPVPSGVRGVPIPAPYLVPLQGDDTMLRGSVFLDPDSSNLLVMESLPVQVTLHLVGSLPTPCHQLRAVVTTIEDQKRVEIELYTLADPGTICIDVLSPFEADLPLGSFSSGTFSVYINGELFRTFDA